MSRPTEGYLDSSEGNKSQPSQENMGTKWDVKHRSSQFENRTQTNHFVEISNPLSKSLSEAYHRNECPHRPTTDNYRFTYLSLDGLTDDSLQQMDSKERLKHAKDLWDLRWNRWWGYNWHRKRNEVVRRQRHHFTRHCMLKNQNIIPELLDKSSIITGQQDTQSFESPYTDKNNETWQTEKIQPIQDSHVTYPDEDDTNAPKEYDVLKKKGKFRNWNCMRGLVKFHRPPSLSVKAIFLKKKPKFNKTKDSPKDVSLIDLDIPCEKFELPSPLQPMTSSKQLLSKHDLNTHNDIKTSPERNSSCEVQLDKAPFPRFKSELDQCKETDCESSNSLYGYCHRCSLDIKLAMDRHDAVAACDASLDCLAVRLQHLADRDNSAPSSDKKREMTEQKECNYFGHAFTPNVYPRPYLMQTGFISPFWRYRALDPFVKNQLHRRTFSSFTLPPTIPIYTTIHNRRLPRPFASPIPSYQYNVNPMSVGPRYRTHTEEQEIQEKCDPSPRREPLNAKHASYFTDRSSNFPSAAKEDYSTKRSSDQSVFVSSYEYDFQNKKQSDHIPSNNHKGVTFTDDSLSNKNKSKTNSFVKESSSERTFIQVKNRQYLTKQGIKTDLTDSDNINKKSLGKSTTSSRSKYGHKIHTRHTKFTYNIPHCVPPIWLLPRVPLTKAFCESLAQTILPNSNLGSSNNSTLENDSTNYLEMSENYPIPSVQSSTESVSINQDTEGKSNDDNHSHSTQKITPEMDENLTIPSVPSPSKSISIDQEMTERKSNNHIYNMTSSRSTHKSTPDDIILDNSNLSLNTLTKKLQNLRFSKNNATKISYVKQQEASTKDPLPEGNTYCFRRTNKVNKCTTLVDENLQPDPVKYVEKSLDPQSAKIDVTEELEKYNDMLSDMHSTSNENTFISPLLHSEALANNKDMPSEIPPISKSRILKYSTLPSRFLEKSKDMPSEISRVDQFKTQNTNVMEGNVFSEVTASSEVNVLLSSEKIQLDLKLPSFIEMATQTEAEEESTSVNQMHNTICRCAIVDKATKMHSDHSFNDNLNRDTMRYCVMSSTPLYSFSNTHISKSCDSTQANSHPLDTTCNPLKLNNNVTSTKQIHPKHDPPHTNDLKLPKLTDTSECPHKEHGAYGNPKKILHVQKECKMALLNEIRALTSSKVNKSFSIPLMCDEASKTFHFDVGTQTEPSDSKIKFEGTNNWYTDDLLPPIIDASIATTSKSEEETSLYFIDYEELPDIDQPSEESINEFPPPLSPMPEHEAKQPYVMVRPVKKGTQIAYKTHNYQGTV